MWLKNLQLLRLTGFQYTHESLMEKMEEHRLKPIGKSELSASGWVPLRDGGELAEKVNGAYLLVLGTESKILPDSAIKHVVKARAKELEEQQGFAPGRKAMKELKERITDELMPAALVIPRRIQILIDPQTGWVMIDAAGTTNHDAAVRFLIRSLELPIDSLFTKRRPGSAMTMWVEDDDMVPLNFTVDDEVALKSGNKGVLRLKGVDMHIARDHVATGAAVTQLAMTFDSKLSFVLTDTMVIKRLQPLDILKESNADLGDSHDRYTAEMMLCIDSLRQLVNALVGEALGIAERGEGEAQAEIKLAA